MKEEQGSLRQVLVLTVTGLLATAAELLPGLLAGTAGRWGWLAPLLALPVLLLWAAALCRLFREEGSGLFVLFRRLGKGWGGVLTIIYIVWTVALLAQGVGRCAARLGAVYGGQGGEIPAALMLLLALWSLRKGRGTLFRAGELFWPALAVALGAAVALALPQVEGSYLLPREGEEGLFWAVLEVLHVWGGAMLAAALLPGVSRKEGGRRRVLGWTALSGLGACLLVLIVIGRMGAKLAGELSQPFLLVVQGLSLAGALSRLEAPMAALLLLGDFCRAGLLLAVLEEAGGARWGQWLALLGGGAAAVAGLLLPEGKGTLPGGILLGFAVPVCFYIRERYGGGGKENHILWKNRQEKP